MTQSSALQGLELNSQMTCSLSSKMLKTIYMPRRFIDYNEVKLQIIFNRHVQANTRTKFALQKANKLPVLKYPRLLLFYDRFILSDEDDNWVLRFNESDEEGDELGVNPHCNENKQPRRRQF